MVIDVCLINFKVIHFQKLYKKMIFILLFLLFVIGEYLSYYYRNAFMKVYELQYPKYHKLLPTISFLGLQNYQPFFKMKFSTMVILFWNSPI